MTRPLSRSTTWSRNSTRRARAAGWLALLAAAALGAGPADQSTPEPRPGQAAAQPPANPVPPGPAASATQTSGSSPGTVVQSSARIGDASNVVRLTGDTSQVVLTMTGLGAAVDKLSPTDLAAFAKTLEIAPTIRLGQPAAHTATIAVQSPLGRAGAGSLSWLVTVTTKDLPPNTIERRVTTLSIGPKTSPDVFPLEFTLTNQPPATAQYEVTAPGHDWMVSRSDTDPGRTYPLLVVNRSEPLSGLRLAQVSLKRSDDGGNIGFDEVQLLDGAGATATPASIDLAPNEARTVFLRLGKSDRLLPYGLVRRPGPARQQRNRAEGCAADRAGDLLRCQIHGFGPGPARDC